MTQLRFTAAAAALTVACGGAKPAQDNTGAPVPAISPGLQAPATFSGEIPCADCPGIRLTLTLRPDKLFILRQAYLGRSGEPSVDLGLWWVSDDRRTLTLAGGSVRLYGGRGHVHRLRNRRRWPDALVGDNRALERGYLEARREPGQPVLVKLRGRTAEWSASAAVTS